MCIIVNINKEQYLTLADHVTEASTELAVCREEMAHELDTILTTYSIENLQRYYFPQGQPAVLYQTPKPSKQAMVYGVGLVGTILFDDQNGC